MTGFGTSTRQDKDLQASVTLRSVNHRYLDVTVHVSRRLLPIEAEIRSRVQSRLARGRVEVLIQAAFPADEGGEVVAAQPLVAGLVRALRQIKNEHRLDGDVGLSDIARFPGALEVLAGPPGVTEDQRDAIVNLVDDAIDGLERMRRAEGERLAGDLAACLASIVAAVDRIESASRESREKRREALLEKARSLLGELALDDARLYQEVVRLVDRSDVAEELQRLRSHVGQAGALLSGTGLAGRQLDFLAQELMREANTLGSKASSSDLVQKVVELKGEIDRLREQAQNVE